MVRACWFFVRARNVRTHTHIQHTHNTARHTPPSLANNTKRAQSPSEIWDALKAAAGADLGTARLLIESAGIIVARPDMTVCYDERGARYELPPYVLADPRNLQQHQQHEHGHHE